MIGLRSYAKNSHLTYGLLIWPFIFPDLGGIAASFLDSTRLETALGVFTTIRLPLY